jgi:hypothetical protein
MDVRIGEIEATIVDTEPPGSDDSFVERVVRRVLAELEQRERSQLRRARDCLIASPDAQDMERYG